MKKVALAFAVALTFCVCAAGQRPGDRVVKPQSGDYMIVVPDSWTYHDAGRIQIMAASVSNGPSPNIVISFDKTNLSLKEYIVRGFKNLIKVFNETDGKIISVSAVSEFVTESGQKGVKIVIGIQHVDRFISQNIYVFDGANGKKWAIGGTAEVKDYSSYNKDFDRIVKSWKPIETKEAMSGKQNKVKKS